MQTTTTILPPLPPSMAENLRRVADAARTHHVVMVGPPGVGKTMIARRVRDTLPPLTDPAERWEVAAVQYWAQGGHRLRAQMNRTRDFGSAGRGIDIRDGRPFRAPHHTVSVAGLAGGVTLRGTGDDGRGPAVRVVFPGEMSLAHRGVLFLDELPEFSRHALDAVRLALADGCVRVASRFGTSSLPARFRMLASMTACPCGFLGHGTRACTCSSASITRWHDRVTRILRSDGVRVVNIGGCGHR